MNPECPPDLCVFTKGDKRVVLNPNAPSWAVLNREGLAVLKLCTGALSVQEIAQNLSLNFEEVNEFIQVLKEYRLLCGEDSFKESSFELQGIWLNVTNACNLKCLTCYQSSGDPYPDELTRKEILHLFQQMRTFKPKNENQTVILTGGEPLLRSDLWEICQIGSDLGLVMNLITNGILVTEEIAQKAKSCINQVQVSLDGIHTSDVIRGKGTFELAVKGINVLQDYQIVPSIGIVVTRINCTEILQLLQFLTDLGITDIRMRPVIHQGRGHVNRSQLSISVEEYQLLVKHIYEEGFSSNPGLLKVERFAESIQAPTNNARGCPAGWRTVSVSSTGGVYPCIAGHISVLSMGSIRERSFADLWESDLASKWRSFDVNSSVHCKVCEWRNFCGGGCKISAYLHSGQIGGGDSYCKAIKNLYYYTLMQECFHEL